MKTPKELEAEVKNIQNRNKKLLDSNKLSNSIFDSVESTANTQEGSLEGFKSILVSKLDTVTQSLSKQILVIQDLLNTNLQENLDKNYSCPNLETLQKALQIRNNVLQTLKTLQDTLEIITPVVSTTQQVISGTVNTITGVNILKTATSAATKLLPTAPGQITALLADLDDIRTIVTFKSSGEPRLPKLESSIKTVQYYIDKTYKLISTIITIVKNIDIILNKCSVQTTIIDTSLLQSATFGTTASTDQYYKGFKLQVIDKPYSQGLTQKIGQGLNSNNIILLQTEPSFTLDPQVLIEELKLIIDRDNLKAN